MKKIFKIVVVLNLFIFKQFSIAQCNAYDSLDATKRKAFIIFSIGSSDPTGRLGNQTVSDNKAGLALTGFNARITGGYKFKENFGFIGISEAQEFPINIQEIADYNANRNPGYNVKVESNKGWSMNNLMFGLYGNFPISEDKRLLIEPRILLGFSMASSPEHKTSVYYLSNGYTKLTYVNQESSVSYLAGVYCIGGGLRYNFCKRLTISGNIDYVATIGEHEFSGVHIEYNTGLWEKRNISMQFSSICITAGIGFRFGNNW